MQKWQMISHNGGILTPKTIELSTVEMPHVSATVGYRYETCVFTAIDSEVLERYDTLVDAIKGHARWCDVMGLKV